MPQDKFNLLISDTAIPDVFVVRYADNLSKSALNLYLWLNMLFKGREFVYKEVMEIKLYAPTETDESLAELVSAGLFIRKGDDFSFVDLKQREVLEFAEHYAARGVTLEGVELRSEEEARNKLADSVSKTFYQGKMPYICYRLIDKCLYEYKFDSLVVYKLFSICRDNHMHRSIGYMEKMASDWNDRGFTDSSKLDEYLSEEKKLEELIKKVSKLTRRKVNGLDVERLSRWVRDLKVSADLVELAYRSNEYRGNITLAHVEETLSKWIAAGISNVDEAAKYEEEQHKENKRKAKRKVKKNGAWITGAEAGLTEEENDKKAEEKPSEDDENAPAFNVSENEDAEDEETGAIDDILDLFGEQ